MRHEERGFHELLERYVTIDAGGWAHEAALRVADRLQSSAAAEERLTPVVLWMEQPTAFTVPGRHVYISRGLLQLGLCDDAIALVFAHELAHHRLGHVPPFRSEVPGAWIVGVLVHAAHFALVSAEKEGDADRWALRRCMAAGYDKRRCLELFDALDRAMLDAGHVDSVFGPGDPEQLAEDELRRLDGEEPARIMALLAQARHWVWTRRSRYESLRERRAALERLAIEPARSADHRSISLLEKWQEYTGSRGPRR